MEKRTLQELDTKNLSMIINEFGKNGIVFQSEAQFQFKLAWHIQELYNCEVTLEDLTVVINEKQKQYTDIVLTSNNGYRVAIELKYKTAKLECGEILLHNHGAVDLGRFDFLWDVNRLELLVNNDKKSSIEQAIYKNKNCSFKCSHLKRCDKGFAVLLTNEQKYWKENWVKETESSDCTIDNQFKFGEKDFTTNTGQLYGNKLNWKLEDDRSYPKTIRGKSGTGTFRARPIELLQAYKYKWEKYPTKNPSDKNNEFRYLIIDVERNI